MFPLAHFLRQELRDAPGRASYTLRLTLSCAVLITLFMTLQIPFLAVALIVVFYVSQPNVLMIKLVSVVFFVTVTVALGGVLLIIKWTYDYPLIRLAASVALFFCALYLMRVLGKLGLAFFVVALAVIYAQTFPSMTSQSEILVRLLLWLWVAINTAILVTLLVNACFQQAFPGNQFKARLAGMLHEVARRLAAPDAEAPPTFGETAAQFNQLQSLFAQASRATPEIAADPQAWRSRLAATLRCYQLAALLQADEADSDDRQQLSQAVLQLKNALSEGPFDGAIPPLTLSGRGVNRAVLQEMATTLQRLAQGEPVALPQGEVEKAPLLAPDAWRNPAYLHFALKTLLATLICYVFYTAADWQGLHTIMLSCVIVAQPGLGATMQKTWLRIGGALLASLLALLLIVFVQPWTDSLTGLLAMSLRCWRWRRGLPPARSVSPTPDPDWFHLCAGLSQLVCSADEPHRAAGSGAGHPARGAGLLHCSFVSLAGQRSAAAENPPCGTLSPAGGLPRRPEGGGSAGSPACRLHGQRSADPPGSRRTAGHVCSPLAPGERLADARHPRPGRGDRPPQRRLPTQRRAGRPDPDPLRRTAAALR
ncbi:tripartite multidrug resistance system membrane fusion protein [Klebsiella pneumoniae]|uniref:Tripartite multidrug resistance system membrane fusion protein n=1 Tax=Klebsiella pneumoniae TaxID=573 RepID=A0A2X3D332_KLEPN|nr:tripartite multidrug resistance system membrane fusion protein [Klebsiella pneumoniae]